MARRFLAEPTEEQFLQPINYSTFRYIEIPKAFYQKYVVGKTKMNFVSLKSPLLCKPLKVKIEGGKLKDGWKAFVKDHGRKVGDYVHFTHEGSLVFYVTTFKGDGNRILYGNNKNKLGSTVEGTIAGEKRKKEYETHESGKAVRSRPRAGIVIKDSGHSQFARQNMMEARVSQIVDTGSYFQTVTHANLKSNSVYIPTKFERENYLKQRKSDILGFLDMNENVWPCQTSICTDGRLKLLGGWEPFCRNNKIEQGYCCEFKLQPKNSNIMLKLVFIHKEGKKTAKGVHNSCARVKEEQYVLDEDDVPGIDFAAMIHDIEGDFRNFAGRSTFEKGQGSRK